MCIVYFASVGFNVYATHSVYVLFTSYYHPTPSSYLVSHIDDMQAMVIVEHEGDFYNLYLSDESGLYFSLSLRDIVIETVNNRYQIDLELVECNIICIHT